MCLSKHLDNFMDACNKKQDNDSMDDLFKFFGQKRRKSKIHIQKTIRTIINHHVQDIIKVNKLT